MLSKIGNEQNGLSVRQMTPDWPKHFTVRHALSKAHLNNKPLGPNCGPYFRPFCCMTSHFRDTSLSKIGNAPTDLRLPVKRSKFSSMHWILCPRATVFFRFTLYEQPLSRYNVVENGKRTDWHQTDLGHWTVKTHQYALMIPRPEAQSFNRFALTYYDQPFSTCQVIKNRKCTV